MADQARLNSATPVLMSGDYERSKTFFTNTLGFAVIEEGGDPARFGIFQRDGAVIYVNAWNGSQDPTPETWDVYFHVDDLQGLAKEVAATGARISKPIHSTVYGMDEFEVTDPDGNVLCFGCDSK